MKTSPACAAIVLWALLTPMGRAQESPPAIHWTSDYQAGLDQAAKEGKGVLLDFTAEWCVWCEKMDTEVFSTTGVTNLLQEYVCIKVDIDKNPDIAGAYQVQSIPRTVFLNVNKEIIGDRLGFVPEPQFVVYLQSQSEDLRRQTGGAKAPEIAAAPTAAALEDSVRLRLATEGINAVLDLLGEPNPRTREIVQAEVLQAGEDAIPVLVAGLGHTYLGTRLSALATLQNMGGSVPDFDPWATAEERAAALDLWKDWLSARLHTKFGDDVIQQHIAAALDTCKNLDLASAQASAARTSGGPVDSWTWIVDESTIVTAIDSNGDARPDEATVFQDLSRGLRLSVNVILGNGAPSAKSHAIEYIPNAAPVTDEADAIPDSVSPLPALPESAAPTTDSAPPAQ